MFLIRAEIFSASFRPTKSLLMILLILFRIMQRKRELKIDTEFFEDHLGLDIPEAILIAPDTEVFIKEGLTEDFNDEDNNQEYDPADVLGLAAQIVERVMSSKLVDNFLFCWQLLKRHPFVVESGRLSQHSQSGHRRQSPTVQNIVTETDRLVSESVEEKALKRQKIGLDRGDISIGRGSNIEWLEQKRELILGGRRREVNLRKDMEKGKDSQLQRARVLKQIVDKLKQSRGEMKGMLNEVDHIRENHHLNHKLNKLERLIQQLHNDRQNHHNLSQTSRIQPQRPETHTNLKDSNSQQDQLLVNKLAEELSILRQQMQLLRKQNEKILREEEDKKIELIRIAQTKEEIKKTYEIVSRQIQQLESDKLNGINAHQTWIENKRREHQFEIVRLQERVKYLELNGQREHIRGSQIGNTVIDGSRQPAFPFGSTQSGWVSSGVRVQPITINKSQSSIMQTQITRQVPLHQTTILKANDPNNEFRELQTANPQSGSNSKALPPPYTPQPLEQSLRVPSDWQSRMQQQGGWGCC